jgi:hypothetical protein
VVSAASCAPFWMLFHQSAMVRAAGRERRGQIPGPSVTSESESEPRD